MCLNLSLHYKLAIVPCKKTYQRPWALARWGNLSSKSYHVCPTLWENKKRIGSSDNTTCLIPWCIMVQALVLGGMYVMCKQKVNEGEKCFSIQPLTKFHFTDYTAIYTDHLNDEWERPQVWLVTEAPFVKFMVSFSPSYLNNVCKIYDNNSFFAEHYLKTWLFFLLFFFTFLHLGRWTMWHFGNFATCLRSGNLPLIYIFFVIYLHMRRVCPTNSVQSSESIWTVKIKDKHKLFHKKLIMTVSHHFLW